MEIVEIYPPYIYSIKYGVGENEFDRLFQLWNDVGFVTQFISDNSDCLKSDVWQGLSCVEDAARQVLDEAEALEDLFEEMNDNVVMGRQPDFDSHFRCLGGKYKYEIEWLPMKSYGTFNPSLLRMYAIRMDVNTYLITGGGIKLADTIQNSPELRDRVLQDIDRVRAFLKENGIFDSDDMRS